jgi:hypothetical protein
MRITGKQLNKEWSVGAVHALYRRDGGWYHNLDGFPGALFDIDGYIKFESREEYERCSSLRVSYGSNTTNVKEPGIRAIPGYVRVRL